MSGSTGTYPLAHLAHLTTMPVGDPQHGIFSCDSPDRHTPAPYRSVIKGKISTPGRGVVCPLVAGWHTKPPPSQENSSPACTKSTDVDEER